MNLSLMSLEISVVALGLVVLLADLWLPAERKRALGYAAEIVSNGRDAIAALRRRRFDLVLMDQQMPELDGLAATRALRAAQAAGDREIQPHLRIVAMTANAMKADRDACLAAGMDDFLPKPVKTEELRVVLARHLAPAAAAA